MDTVTERRQPFMVIATQNPIEMEGTYALPEAQRDRFMVRLSIGYPVEAAEIAARAMLWVEPSATTVGLPEIVLHVGSTWSPVLTPVTLLSAT